MNQTQRSFLIKKIDERVKATIDALRHEIPEAPNLNIYLLHAVMSGTFEIKSASELKGVIRERALKSKEREDWMGNSWGRANKTDFTFSARELFVIPSDYETLNNEYKIRKEEIESQIYEIGVQADTLKTRIQLASDKILQTMINEVDDMGNISLMDEKLKLLSLPKVKDQRLLDASGDTTTAK